MPRHNVNVILAPPVRGPGGVRQAGARARQYTAAAPTLLCQTEPELFFSEDPAELRLAKALCRECPLRTTCLTGALQRGEPWGVWGGELFQDGQIIPGKRPRGRPRKAAVAA